MSSNNKNVGFEMLEFDENSVTFKRVLPSKGRTSKENTAIEMSLPKATIHFFTNDEFQKLKAIENEILQKKTSKKHFKNLFSRFFEI